MGTTRVFVIRQFLLAYLHKMSKEFSLFFVLPTNCEDEQSTSSEMQEAFQAYLQNRMNPEWIRESDILKENLTKKDIVVFDKFEGATFEEINKHDCLRVVGPRCMLLCLLNNIQVPSNGSPIYNIAMINMKISITNISTEKKNELQKKIEYMGGVYTSQITTFCTHLISNGTRSKKYNMAVINKIPIMLESWVEAVWEGNKIEYHPANEAQYISAHKCPTLHELVICATGFEDSERKELQQIIEQNGGHFTLRMNIHHTHILLCRSTSCKSEKFLSAVKNKIPCVSKQWLLDSIEAGTALIEDSYVINVSSSTPTKHSKPLDFNMTCMSIISGPYTHHGINNSTLDATNISLYGRSMNSSQKSHKEKKENNVDQKILNIDLKKVKMSGPFLDGCSIFIIGFSSTARDKLCRILKTAGATRYDDMSDRVTQVLIGDENCHEIKLLVKKGCSAPIVPVEWLMESIETKQPAPEENYTVSIKGSPATKVAPSSPSVSRGLDLLRANTSTAGKDTIVRCLEFNTETNTKTDDIMQHYLTKAKEDEDDTLARLIAGAGQITNNQTNMNQNEPTSSRKDVSVPERSDFTSNVDDESCCIPIFKNKTFIIMGFNEENTADLITIIKQRCGLVKSVNYSGIPDYLVVPTFTTEINITASETVNHLYISDCDNADEIIPKKYYHEPIVTNEGLKPLQGLVITATNYASSERGFVREIIEYLGGDYQNTLAKVAQGKTGPKASTHLVCKEPVGKKYVAAMSWGIPVIDHRWLLACLQADAKVDEMKYFITINTEDKEGDTNETPKKDNKTESCLNSKYFPSAVKHGMSKLDISTSRRETPKKDSPFVNFDSKSIEKSMTICREVSDSKTIDEVVVQKEVFVTPVAPRRFTEKDMNKTETPKNTGTPMSVECQESKENQGEALIDLDGEKVSFGKFMQHLRDKGLFERGSPAEKYNVSPYIVPQQAKGVSTPQHNDSGETASQDTPIGKYIQHLQQRKLLPGSAAKAETPDSPLPRALDDIRTPNTPLGAFLCEGDAEPSPNTRKYWQRRIDRLPGPSTGKIAATDELKTKNRRVSSPISGLTNQAWDWLLNKKNNEESFESFKKRRKISEDQCEKVKTETDNKKCDTPQDNIEVTNNLKQFQSMLSSTDHTGSGRRGSLYNSANSTPQKSRFSHLQCNLFADKDSQPDYIVWKEDAVESEDFIPKNTEKQPDIPKKFMLSSMTNELKQSSEKIIISLNATVSSSTYFDPTATHIVCVTPSRNEKILSSMASGKYIVHILYLQESEKKGEFLNEEHYELGNPKFKKDITFDVKPGTNMEAYYWWRNHIKNTGKKAFHGMRIVLVVNNKEALKRLIEAGDGVVINVSPPFSHNIDATHCLMDYKCAVKPMDLVPLAKQGIPCINVNYISEYLYCTGNVDLRKHTPLELLEFYNY